MSIAKKCKCGSNKDVWGKILVGVAQPTVWDELATATTYVRSWVREAPNEKFEIAFVGGTEEARRSAAETLSHVLLQMPECKNTLRGAISPVSSLDYNLLIISKMIELANEMEGDSPAQFVMMAGETVNEKGAQKKRNKAIDASRKRFGIDPKLKFTIAIFYLCHCSDKKKPTKKKVTSKKVAKK